MDKAQIMSQKPGRDLKRLRESKGITLEQAAKDTCLRAGFLEEIENCATPDDLPGVYHRLSLKMYSRYLGLEVDPDSCPAAREEKLRIAPTGMFIRRMGRPTKNDRSEPAQRSPIFGLIKTTAAAVVVVLAFGLWSLNAKLSRLNIDDLPNRAERTAASAPAAPTAPPEATASQPAGLPSETTVELDRCILLTLSPAATPHFLDNGTPVSEEAAPVSE